MRVKVRVSGIVQGVGFRPFVYRTAVQNDLSGYVRNRGDAGVDILLEGSEAKIRDFLTGLKDGKPPLSQIFEMTAVPLRGKNEYSIFTIFESSRDMELSGSVIPPDVAICDECLEELRDSGNRRYDYFFVTCTNCGPRYTIIEKLPYDRKNTTMKNFVMCDYCRREYSDAANRRFHAQTIACSKCGPKTLLVSKKGEPMQCKNPILEAGKLLSEGSIIAIKGYGGFHIAASTVLDEPLVRLRKAKHRSQKPFAIMARNPETVKTFAELNPKENEALTSLARPIVLLNKNPDYYLSDLVAPGLHNVGVVLPYTGLHYMLFDEVDDSAFVMTSANPPNQPIVKEDTEARKQLVGIADYFLFHSRHIAHRCDDSVMRVHGESQVFLRRSRGYVPAPVIIRNRAKHCAVGLGGEQNNTACVLLGEKAFVSQHIGDVENVETREFLEATVKRLISITNSKVEVVACDLHPKFTTTKLAHELAEENNWQLIKVQHHHAHIVALMAEYGVEEIIGICCDGYGYGPRGESWGGEILFCGEDFSRFERLSHLQNQPLLGGDLATRYPLRTAAGILSKETDIETWLLQNKKYFPYGEREIHVIFQQLQRNKGLLRTTSCGRVLDAAAAILDLCYERTYEGEPAMKLESVAINGRDVLGLEPLFEEDVLNTTHILLEIFENKEKLPRADLAYSVHAYLAKGLASLAIKKASEKGVETVGFSGGVACNQIINSEIHRLVESSGLRFLVHEAVPPGDGGLSFGQAIVASNSNS